MNYHELKKQANLPQLKPAGGVICAPDGEHLGQMSTRGSSDINRCWHGSARAAVVCHCVNNFDKALARLKNEAKYGGHSSECASRGPAPYDGEPSDKGCNCIRRSLLALIAELEDVK